MMDPIDIINLIKSQPLVAAVVAIITSAKVIAIIISGIILYYVLKAVIRRSIGSALRKAKQERRVGDVEVRRETLTNVAYFSLRIVVLILITIMILQSLGVEISAILAVVGIAGLAIGLATQDLIKDVINGFFILVEDQYGKGDVVRVAGTSGYVEEVNLRKTVLRDLDGIQHHIPNREITVASNFTKNLSRMNLEIPVAYSSDLDKVIKVIDKVGKDMAKDPEYKADIIDPPHCLGVNNFGDSAIMIKVLGETQPLKQWNLMRVFKKKIKQAFDKEGIVIPFPQRDVHMKKD